MADIKQILAVRSAFHGTQAIDVWGNAPSGTVDYVTVEKQRRVIEDTRTLRYRISAHFHPFVREMDARLIERSVAGLQALDTEYVSRSDGAFAVLPGSLRARIPNGIQVTLPKPGRPGETETATLVGAIDVALPDGVTVKLDGGAQATLPGTLILRAEERGLRVSHSDGGTSDLAFDGPPVTLAVAVTVLLPEATVVRDAAGGVRKLTEPALITAPAGESIVLRGALPRPKLYRDIFSGTAFTPSDLVELPFPSRDLDFSSSGAYAAYNWEVFCHIPLLVASHCTKSGRFAEAQQWLHYLFDPTDNSDGPSPERFWKVKPFQFTQVRQIEEILVNLSSGANSTLQQDTINAINAWKDNPFRPHLVARYRQTAYMHKIVMAYLDNLIAWGDSLFQQDTGESINEATQLYVLAALILGERPQQIPAKGAVAPLTYASRRDKWDALGNTLEQLESEIPFDFAPTPMTGTSSDKFATLQSIGTTLYFCVPHNDKLLRYWDMVAERLFKIRNSLNLQGVFRQLPLFEPPIDPAMLARAAAAGVDVAAVVAGANQPLPLARFQILIQKATELCQEVKSLGANLLSVLEKADGEALAILRAKHEQTILGLARQVKYAQWQEALKNRESSEIALANAQERYLYNERQLGRQAGEVRFPERDPMDLSELTALALEAGEGQIDRVQVAINIAQDLGSSGGKIISSFEAEELSKSELAREAQDLVKGLTLAAKGSIFLPEFITNFHFWGLGGSMNIIGGQKLSKLGEFAAEVAVAIADRLSYEAGRAGRMGQLDRRQQDLMFQSQSLAGEINQTIKQLRAAEIRAAMAEIEWNNHAVQIRQAEEIENFLTNEKKGKTTNAAFYSWMKREVYGLHDRCHKMACEAAQKAQRALQHELGRPDLSFLEPGYTTGKEGLLAGERLLLDLKRMETAYLDLNKREYELSKHISLQQVDPMALLMLRTVGRCSVTLPEALFDMDGPGHYFRRIRSVAVSIPCVAGPYTSVNCRLTLTSSSIRKEASASRYARSEQGEDARFDDHFGRVQAIVTSSAQSDSGLFEANLRDERYLPFEGHGAISTWELQLPSSVRQFDYSTISDVVLHVRYTAREGGDLLREAAQERFRELVSEAKSVGSVRLFSMRHEFPTEWVAFLDRQLQEEDGYPLKLKLREEHYPFWARAMLDETRRVEFFVENAASDLTVKAKLNQGGSPPVEVALAKDREMGGMMRGAAANEVLPDRPLGEFALFLSDKSASNVWIGVTWGAQA